MDHSPTFLEKTQSFVTALINHAKIGFHTVSKEQLLERLSICDTCPKVRKSVDGEIYKCGACGCYLHNKASWSSSKCPLGKWTQTPSGLEQ